MFRYFLYLLIVLFSVIACSGGNDTEENQGPEIPVNPPGGSGNNKDKAIQLWIDAHANFSRLATQSNITANLQRMKDTGFNEVYVDVKPGIGYALYDSDILPPLTKWGSETVERDWDYLQFWIDEAEKFDIKVIASISTLGFGSTTHREGLVYDDSRWDGKTQMAMVNNDPNNMEDIRERSGVDAAFLNPVLPEVQSFVISIVEEIVTKYPKLKGFCLDYCRWYNNDEGRHYGFEDATIEAFENYIGQKVNSKNEIITDTGGMGPLFSQWTEFRSMTITNLITNIRSKIKSIDPKMELHLWASAHWSSRYSVAQNWASKNFVPTGGQYTSTYSKTGFADQLDVFSLGAYAEAVWKSENPSSDWSVENFVTTYDRYIMGDCKVYGSIGTYAYGSRAAAISDAVFLCLGNTDGLMVFELSHVINNNQWAAIKDGIERGMK
jgi:uncharacterized lipoprotein YddW (UPF0748 family)